MKHAAIILFFQLLGFGVFAQNNTFTVLAKSGSVVVGNTEAKIGQLIKSDNIQLGSNAYLGLISSNGKPVELNAEGSYSLNDLNQKLGESSGTFSDQFVSFMASEMNESDEDYTAGMGVTGSVERALLKSKVFIPLPKKSKFIGNKMYLQWLLKDDNQENSFTVDIMDMSEEIVFSKEVKGSETFINPYEVNTLIPGDLYLLRINNNGDKAESNTVCFYLPSEEENKEICTELGPLLDAQSTTLESIAAAQMLSEKGFHMAALKKYHEAILADDNGVAKNSFSAYVNSLK
jgi:hypothetical protein